LKSFHKERSAAVPEEPAAALGGNPQQWKPLRLVLRIQPRSNRHISDGFLAETPQFALRTTHAPISTALFRLG
jgi:hypothetical protein